MRNILLFIAFTCSCVSLNAQYQDKLWLLGYDCCVPMFSGINMDFRNGPLVIDTFPRKMNFLETNGSICDSVGNLLFYSNGVYISNALDDTMDNGSGLNPSDYTASYYHDGLPISQGNLIIPMPGNSNRYYLFHETVDDRYYSYCSFYLYYSIIDMALNGGLGGVIQKNVILLNDSLIAGHLTACKHANGRDWWIYAPRFGSLSYIWLVTPYGISTPIAQDLYSLRQVIPGQVAFSIQGDKFAYYDSVSNLDIWDFDRCTGQFSNQVHISINDSATCGGLAFSPTGRYLYISSMNFVYQFDLYNANISSSRVTVGTYDGHTNMGLYTNFYLCANGPDGKIYINSPNGAYELHAINEPDSAGLNCNFCQHCISLPAWNAFTMPNFPNYYLREQMLSVCDTVLAKVPEYSISDFRLFPNPAHDYITLSSDYTNWNGNSVVVYDALGNFVVKEQISGPNQTFQITLPPALYFFKIYDEKNDQVAYGKICVE